MYDQSFNTTTLARVLQVGDERNFPSIKFLPNKLAALVDAVDFAHTGISTVNPFNSFNQKGRTVFQAKQLAHQLVLRKLGRNLNNVAHLKTPSRESIVSNLINLLSEGIPYRVYRLDIKQFYESFDKTQVLDRVNSLDRLSPLTKRNIEILFSHHTAISGLGVPRGLALSASLSELMMQDFDSALVIHPHIYFSARYVDDIVILSNGEESEKSILQYVKKLFPIGLKLNQEKTKIVGFENPVNPFSIPRSTVTTPWEFNYLGYKLNVSEPLELKKIKRSNHRRFVTVDIAESKTTRTKTRITKSFIAFAKDKNFPLLSRRLRFITANFRVRDARTGRPNLAGIYYSYPLLTSRQQLENLDAYLRHAVFSTAGPVYLKTAPHLTAARKRQLIANSFVRGHQEKTFMHFNGAEIEQLQECWKYE